MSNMGSEVERDEVSAMLSPSDVSIRTTPIKSGLIRSLPISGHSSFTLRVATSEADLIPPDGDEVFE